MSAPRSVEQTLSGWGHHPVERCDVYRPEREDTLRQVVLDAPESHLIARGNGRAYGDAALNAGAAVIDSARLDRMLAFDPESGVLHTESAVTLADIIDVFLPRGFFFPVTPGTKFISVGGAVAADVHGKNHHRDGSLGGFLRELTLMLASGERMICSRESNADLFWATIGGMGLTGVIIDAKIALRPVETAWVRARTDRTRDLDETLDRIISGDRDHAYAVAWVDCMARGKKMGRSVLLRADPASPDELPARTRAQPLRISPPLPLAVPFRLPAGSLNRLSMSAFNAVYYATHRRSEQLTNYESYFYPLDAVRHWNRIYGKKGVLQYQIAVPLSQSREAMVKIIDRISGSRRASFLVVLKSMGAQGEGLLSFPREGTTLSLDFPYTGPELIGLLHELDEIVLGHGGRVYLAKDACLRAEHVPLMYPRLDEFREIKSRVDPDGRFSSSLARRLGIVDSI